MSGLEPGSREWLGLVTASKVAAIIGVSPWESPRSLWHRMRGELPEQVETRVQGRGLFLEPGILAWWQAQHPEYDRVQPQPLLRREHLAWAAATPDALATGPGVPPLLVEAKSAARPEEWGSPGTDAIPTHYLAQTYWQMHMAQDLDPAPTETKVAVLGAFLEFAEYTVAYDPDIGADLEARCRVFYESLTADVPPPLDGHVATLEALRALHPEIDRGQAVELSPDLAARFAEAVRATKRAEAVEREARVQVLAVMGRAQYASCAGARIARRQPTRGAVALIPYPVSHMEGAAA